VARDKHSRFIVGIEKTAQRLKANSPRRTEADKRQSLCRSVKTFAYADGNQVYPVG